MEHLEFDQQALQQDSSGTCMHQASYAITDMFAYPWYSIGSWYMIPVLPIGTYGTAFRGDL